MMNWCPHFMALREAISKELYNFQLFEGMILLSFRYIAKLQLRSVIIFILQVYDQSFAMKNKHFLLSNQSGSSRKTAT